MCGTIIYPNKGIENNGNALPKQGRKGDLHMKSRNCTMVRNSLLLLSPALMLVSAKAATPQTAPDRRRDADWTPTSMELRIFARHQGAARFHVIDNGATLQV